MGFWKRLIEGAGKEGVVFTPNPRGDSMDDLLKILEGMEVVEAQKLAGLSYLMARVAHSDLEIDEVESGKMVEIARNFTSLSEDRIEKLIELSKQRNEIMGTEGLIISRHLRSALGRTDLIEVLHCLFAVAAADDSISAEEEAMLRQISSELGFSDSEFISLRSEYRDKRAVLK